MEDRAAGDVIDLKFNTTLAGAPITLAGSPVISVYKDNSTTESTAGVTLTVDFDGRTGMHHVRITTASDGTFYANGSDFQVVVTTGTVNGVSIAGLCVGVFSLANRAINWGKVANPTTTVGLTGTTISSAQVVASVTGAVGSVTGAVGSVTGNVGGNVAGSVASVTGAVGSVTGNVGGNVTGSVGSVVGNVGGNVVGSVASVTAAVTVGTNNDKTGYALTSGERTSIADALLDRDMSVGTDSGSPTVRTVRQALRFLRNLWQISAGTLTVFKEDDVTTSWTAAVTTTAGNPVSKIDPA